MPNHEGDQGELEEYPSGEYEYLEGDLERHRGEAGDQDLARDLEDLEGDLERVRERDLEGVSSLHEENTSGEYENLEGDPEQDRERDLEGVMERDLEGDLEQDRERDLEGVLEREGPTGSSGEDSRSSVGSGASSFGSGASSFGMTSEEDSTLAEEDSARAVKDPTSSDEDSVYLTPVSEKTRLSSLLIERKVFLDYDLTFPKEKQRKTNDDVIQVDVINNIDKDNSKDNSKDNH
jgi:hypothetical protein